MDFKERNKYIGGSDIAAVMGLSRWKTPLQLWAEKTGRLENELSNFEAVEIGTELEEYVARKFEKKTGIKLRRDSRDFKHPEHAYMVGHIDRLVLDGESIFEAKTTSAYNLREWEGEEIPQEYILQIMWYMGLTGRERGYVAVLIGGQKFRWKELRFDKELFERMVESAKHFWEEFVLKDVAPMAVGEDNAILGSLYPAEEAGKTLFFEGEEANRINLLIEERAGAIEAKKEAEKCAKDIEAQVKQMMKDAESADTGQYKITWKTIRKAEYVVKAQQYRQLNCRPIKQGV